jgi:hypothetical protein
MTLWSALRILNDEKSDISCWKEKGTSGAYVQNMEMKKAE